MKYLWHFEIYVTSWKDSFLRNWQSCSEPPKSRMQWNMNINLIIQRQVILMFYGVVKNHQSFPKITLIPLLKFPGRNRKSWQRYVEVPGCTQIWKPQDNVKTVMTLHHFIFRHIPHCCRFEALNFYSAMLDLNWDKWQVVVTEVVLFFPSREIISEYWWKCPYFLDAK